MFNLKGYKLPECVHEGAHSVIFRGRREEDRLPVIVKLYRLTGPNTHISDLLKKKELLLKTLSFPEILRPVSVEKTSECIAEVFEDRGLISLTRYFSENSQRNIYSILQIFVGITTALRKIHEKGLVLGNLCPSHVLLNVRTLQVTFTDFSQIRLQKNIGDYVFDLNRGHLEYISPEQTLKTPWAVECRSDLYSLGIALYEGLSGHLPFKAISPVEIVHAHLAKEPLSLKLVDTKHITPLMQICEKLLKKDPWERYQTASGLLADLEHCAEEMETTGQNKLFTIGLSDHQNSVRIPGKIIGRKKELSKSEKVFSEAQSEPSSFLFIKGPSGIGKSAFCEHVKRNYLKKGAWCVTGKFGQFIGKKPYTALVQAFSELSQRLLTCPPKELASWKEQLSHALSGSSKCIVDLVPELSPFFKKTQTISSVGGKEAENRFLVALQRFVSVFCRQGPPLVLFFDDLQWADTASLKALLSLAADRENRGLLVIGSFRSETVDEQHPVTTAIREIEEAGSVTQMIELMPLSNEDGKHFLAQALGTKTEKISLISSLVMEKTHGNPFFLNQFLAKLERDGLLFFDLKKEAWKCKTKAVAALETTKNVALLLSERLRMLSEKAITTLQIASCTGSTFDKRLISSVSDSLKTEEVDIALREAESFGLIRRESRAFTTFKNKSSEIRPFRFVHDKVEQAAYASIEAKLRAEMHRKIALHLLRTISKKGLPKYIFPVAGHINSSQILPVGSDLAARFARCNYLAAKRARDGAAFESALEFTRAASRWWALVHKRRRAIFGFELKMLSAEMEFLAGSSTKSEELAQEVLKIAPNDVEYGRVVRVMVGLYVSYSCYEKALEWGRMGLTKLGVPIPNDREDLQLWVKEEMDRFTALKSGKRVADFTLFPEMKEDRLKVSLEICPQLFAAAFIVEEYDFFAAMVFHMVNSSIEFGLTPQSSNGFVTLGVFLINACKDYESGFDFGQLGLKVGEKYNDPFMDCMNNHAYATFINHWKGNALKNHLYYKRGYMKGIEGGCFEFVGYLILCDLLTQVSSGHCLDLVFKEATAYLSSSRTRIKNVQVIEGIQLCLQFVKNLKGKTADRLSFGGTFFDEPKWIALTLNPENKNQQAASYYLVLKLFLLVVRGEFAKARESASFLEIRVSALEAMHLYPLFCFCHTVALSSGVSFAKKSEINQVKEKLRFYQSKFSHWAKLSPCNYSHFLTIVKAQLAAIEENQLEVLNLYNQAIREAETESIFYVKAIVSELTASFCKKNNMARFSRMYLEDSRNAYEKWGATHKARELEKQSPHLLPYSSAQSQTGSMSAESKLDLISILQASQTISGQINVKALSDALLQIVIKNSGSTKGVLITEKEGSLHVQAECRGEEKGPGVSSAFLSLEDPRAGKVVPVSVITSVWRSKTETILNFPAKNPVFHGDTYFRTHSPKSLYCYPILRKSGPVDILYLENELTPSIFNAEKTGAIQLLAGQIAISLENAILYEEVSQEVEERKKTEKFLRDTVLEKEVLLQEIHHRVKNNLQVISSLLRLQARGVRPKEEGMVVDAARNRIESMALIHDSLYHSGNLSSIDLGKNVKTLVQHLSVAFGVPPSINVLMDIQPIEVKIGTAVSVALIVNEMVSNAFKHAFPNGKKGSIKITLKRVRNKCRLTVSDDGKGFSEEGFQPVKSLGMKVMDVLVNQIAGTLKRENKKRGVTLSMSFDCKAPVL